MITFRGFCCAVLVATATFTMLADWAAARGGSHGKHARGHTSAVAARMTQPKSPTAPLAANSNAAAAAVTTTKLSATALAVANSIILPAPTPPTPTAPTPAPVSAIGTPAGQLPVIAPLSQPVTTPVLGSSGAPTIASPSPSSPSPTEAAPSIAGGGGKTLEDCMSFWEPATHMTKVEWKGACIRSQRRLDSVKL